MGTVITLLLAGSVLVVLWLGTELRREPSRVRRTPLRAPHGTVSRAQDLPGVGRHDDWRCPR